MNMQSLHMRVSLQKLSNFINVYFHAPTFFDDKVFNGIILTLLKVYFPYPVFGYVLYMNYAMLDTPASMIASNGSSYEFFAWSSMMLSGLDMLSA